MILFFLDLIKRVSEIEWVSYLGCVASIAFFYVRITELFGNIMYLLPEATTSQLVYLCMKQYFKSSINYLIFDGCTFSTLYLVFHLLRYLFFGRLNADELTSINDMLASTTMFRLIFMFYVFYYYNDLEVFEFAFWSVVTELTLCLKAISHLVILRCKLVPQSFSFASDQALPVCPDLAKYTALTVCISLSCSTLLIYACYAFFYAHTGILPLLCLLADTIIVVFDNIHALSLIAVHFYRTNTDIYVYYTNLLCTVFEEILKLLQYLLVIYVIGFSFSLIGVYVVMRVRTSYGNIRGNIKAYRSYQQIYEALNHQYPDATQDELIIRNQRRRQKKEKKHTPASTAANLLRNIDAISDQKDDVEDVSAVAQAAVGDSLLLSPETEPEHESDEKTVDPEPLLPPVENDIDNDDDSSEDSDSDTIEYELCGICREAMTEAKKLPCSHKFHLRCLMGWMRYKHNCPICRCALNQNNSHANANANANAAPNNDNANDNANENANNNNNNDNGNLMNDDNVLPWWLRLFSNFIQIHNVDIIDARNLNVPRGAGGAGVGNLRRRIAQQHRVPSNQSTEEQITRISEILGGRVPDHEIRVRLLRTHSMERTIEYFLSRA